jgi:hypothetical protein
MLCHLENAARWLSPRGEAVMPGILADDRLGWRT